MEEYTREPCPYRIGEDVGSAFTMGLIGGSIFQSFIGYRNSAKGQKLIGALREVRMRAPMTGVQFAAWGGMFSTIDCCMIAIRKKEDPLNSIVSGTLTGGLLAVRSGPKVMAASAVLGGVILGMIEGVSMMMGRLVSDQAYDQQMGQHELEDPRNLPSKPSQVEDVGHNKDSSPFGLPTLSLLSATAEALRQTLAAHTQHNDLAINPINIECYLSTDGWERSSTKCLKVYQIERSWPQALAFCARYGSQLARVESNKENDYIGRMLTKPQISQVPRSDYWIGLVSNHRDDADDMFMWSDGSIVSRYTGFWAKGNPDHSAGSCTKVSINPHASPSWKLSVCNILLPFVCELPACVKGSFFCHNGACVPSKDQCNGVNDCGDFSDEQNCPVSREDMSCMKFEKGESGQIHSPNYPSSYRLNSNCRWVIESPINSRIQLTFDYFETEKDQDLVQVVDGGPSENSTVVLATLSGTRTGEKLTFTSSTNMMSIRFRSDSMIQARGFHATWRAVSYSCGGNLKAQTYGQTINSPDYPHGYLNGIECAWKIEATEGELVSLSVDHLDLPDDHDFLVIYDGPTPAARVLARLSGTYNTPQLIISSQSNVYIYFYTNQEKSGKGFSIGYKRGCNNVISQLSGTILSPGHTRTPYPTSQTCQYTIELPDSKTEQPISLAVNHFDVQGHDSLKIFEDGSDGRKLHSENGFNENNRPPKMIYGQKRKMQLVFSSNSLLTSNGWNVTFSSNCKPIDTPKQVSLSSQNTAFGSKVTVSCPRGYEFVNGRGQTFDIQCMLGGQWTEDFIPACQPIYCAPVPQIANGYAHAATNVTFGGSAKYSCYKGFSFPSGKQSEEIFCTDEGRWTPAPTCKAQNCPALSPFANGERILEFGDGTGYGTVFRFECAPGYMREGAATLLCQTNGQWSYDEPYCRKMTCFDIPKIENGRIVVEKVRMDFGDSARVECDLGFRAVGADTVKCLANQTLSTIPECEDIDECAEGLANCAVQSTKCINMPGGYFCQCLKGFHTQLTCSSSASLQPVAIAASSEDAEYREDDYFSKGWCAEESDTKRTITFTFAVPKIIDRLRVERTDRNAYPTELKIRYSNQTGTQLLSLAPPHNETWSTKNVAIVGSEHLVLPKAIEARVLEITIEKHHVGPCVKLDILGCQKTSCMDINECEENNGYCQHHCLNSQGSYKCSCDDGFDLLVEDGQGGIHVKEGESGYGRHDVYKFNRTCVPRSCSPVHSPENGKLISTTTSFHYPMVVEFQCDFGHQMMGPERLKCLSDGTWNGSMPLCIPATCQGAHNNSAIGLFVTPENSTIAYGKNVSIICSQQNRPAKNSLLSSFRQCIYDPQPDGRDYWLSGSDVDCPLVDCGPPPVLSGAFYEGEENSFKVGSSYTFSCRPPYSLVGKSSYDDRIVRCNVDGTWDLGDLRCEGPVCVDPGFPDDGQISLNSVEEGAQAKFTCNRPGYEPFPSSTINCTLGTACVLSEDVGISSGFIPDGAFADNSDSTTWGYEPHKARMSSTGWCGSKDAFIFLSVDLQRIYTLTTLRMAGVAGSGHQRGHVTKMQLFYKVQFSQNYDTYPVEFETPSGNHNKMHVFELNPPLRARYILLGVTEYELNPCIRFDMQGCLAPLSAAHEVPSHLQVGWNASVPQCMDAEPPVFHNCPSNPVYILSDENGQLLPATYDVPQATDNSGSVSYMRVKPDNFEPPQLISSDTDVIYTVFDEAGNSAECVVQLRIPDTQPPVMKCPDSYSIYTRDNESEQTVYFNESSVQMVIKDMSNISEVVFEPSEAKLKIGDFVTVEVSASDEHSNRNKCKFQVSMKAESCSPLSLKTSETTVPRCRTDGDRTRCRIECKPGYRFLENNATVEDYVCMKGNEWAPSNTPPSCIKIAEEPARYQLTVTIKYVVSTPVGPDCLRGYTDLAAAFFDGLDATLSQRCSSSVQVFVRFLDVHYAATGNEVIGNYTVQILPTVLQDKLYELCGLTLRTIFDLNIPGATVPIKNLLSISGETIATQGIGCPSINAVKTSISQGFGCADGELLMDNLHGNLPECLPCPKGTAHVNNTCRPCPVGSYQDEMGQIHCKSCSDHTFTLFAGSQSADSCLPVCGNGMYSETGMIPCQLCPRHTFSGPPIFGGYKQCEPCPQGTYTAKLGSTGPSFCKQPCPTGHFSVSGLEPCSPCPVNFYQPNLGQQRCIACANNTKTTGGGKSNTTDCEPIDCSKIKCENKGTCSVVNHKAVCECRPGYTGAFCEQQMPLCDTQPCYNDGICEATAGTFRCICAQNFTGSRCQFGPDECIGVNCPNGGVCQDLPGLGTTKCICRTGFTGPDCSQIVNPCQTGNPCKNGADCIPLQLGRFKCKCLPGWDGPTCQHNVDDCADKPCALNATCHDLVNDFECDCPKGFSGKRCHIKENLCDPDPCVHGLCVDTLFEQKCVCKPGWTGEFCEKNIDDCENQPCQNGATCRDQEDGFVCQCPPGFHGSVCQHMVDHCATAPCRNNGTCTNMGANYRCDCLLGFEGTHCEHNINECDLLNMCSPEGTEICIDGVNNFQCKCRPGYTGEHCEQHIEQCSSQPCMNNGTCIDMGATFRCECPSGWRGATCEQEAGSCDLNPCLNEGHCVNLVGDYFCVCPEGVSGKNCEIAPNRCIGEPCHNGGVCGDFGSRLECTCPKGFHGKGCQYSSDSCEADVCKNDGTCERTSDGYTCVCPPGFTGVDCGTNIDDCSPSPCPLAATCIDQINTFHCQCPFNLTGSNCDKPVDIDYDIHFYDSIQPAQAALSVPFKFQSNSLTLSLWVKFDNENTRGSILSLYNSATANYPSQIEELVKISSDAVRIGLFSGETPINIHFPVNQRINDGKWNHLVVTWNSRGGTYSVIWNSIRIYVDKGYGNGKTIDINAWIALGHPISDAPQEPKFVGSVTRVNVWSRELDFESEVPQLARDCQGAHEMFDGLMARFADYNRLAGKVEKITKSTCGRSACKGHRCHEEQTPSVRMCPGDMFVVTAQREVNVTWQEPLFASSNGIARVEHNLRPGQMFTWGEYTILYVAYDNDNNSAVCTFKIHVSREFCPTVESPIHGIQVCDNWGPDLKFKACSVECEEGYEFSTQPSMFYTCAADGRWSPKIDGSYGFRYPQCSKYRPAEKLVEVSVKYPSVSMCSTSGNDAVAEKIANRLKALDDRKNICAMRDENGCVDINIVLDCIHSDGRMKRAADKVLKIVAQIPVKKSNDSHQSESIASIIKGEIIFKDLFNLEQILPNGRPDLSTISVEEIYKCNMGEVVVNDVCVPCGPGTYFESNNNACKSCPIGHYQNATGQTACHSCPAGKLTTGPGALDAADCKTHCQPGHYLNLDTEICESCGYGFYQPSSGSFACIPCGIGKTTLLETSTSEDECRDECPDGEQLTAAGSCQACPLGTYRTQGEHKNCVECPPGTTTETTSSVKRMQCNTPKCVAGQFLVTVSKQCQFCPRGTYQDENQRTSCKLCPPDHTTAAQGATRESQCYSTNQCKTGEDNCSWHAICNDLPDDNDIPSFECKCKPGYRGNGTYCEDACKNFCLNDGTCKKNPVGYVECVCKEGFSGERCEVHAHQDQVRYSYVLFGIGATAAIIVIIVAIVWMIIFRAHRATESLNGIFPEKPPMAASMTANNFLYGRPSMADRPPSSLAGGQPIRPIGYYYEDDEEYESKTMFVGDDAQREFEERVQHVQQHMYHPKQNADNQDDL
ncbi:hypothetical protein QR680_002734 [Steinernema hermaphroditum]|uniref:Uncharacterized protein n=1 Tax=Steinernema hermaphroditum TaxID=289476 RepID=A0AA39H3W3_9BILA|nr:hypothetical protein QR680_002734 [Steinernema hermaphroditum]